MQPSYELDACHRLMIDYLGKLIRGEIRKLAVITPPRIGKTLLGNIMVPAFVLGRDPTERIISVSYGSELSETWGRRVRNSIGDPTFREIFPGCQLSADSAAAYRFETTRSGEYSAVGRGGPVTGKGASLLILDDLIKDASEANSEVTCRSTIDWIQNVAFTRLTPTGRVLAIGTRWSDRDPMGWILQQAGWTVLHLPALAMANDPLGREPGEALWPSQFPVHVLEQIKRDIGGRNFETLYMGNTSAAGGTIFKREWFQRYQQRPEKFSRIIQSWDTSFKTGATNDYSVGVTVGVTQTGFYLLNLVRGKWEFPELKRQFALQADMWRPSEILIEDRASGQSLNQELKLATNYPVIPIKADRDKETRASATTGYYESSRVLFPADAPWVADLEDELASFPGGLHDDQVDALSQALNRLRGSGDDLTLVNWMRDNGLGWLTRPPRIQRAIPAAIAEQASPTACCGAPLPRAIAGRLICRNCGKDQNPPVDLNGGACDCGNGQLHIFVGGGQLKCNGTGRQWWPSGVSPRPFHPYSRKDLPPHDGGWRN
jgi:predicted phage terminase large subunit-like protein